MKDLDVDGLMRQAFGMSDAQIARQKAIVPGAGTAELTECLRDADKSQMARICEEHAVYRAEEMCTEYKDGDLLYRDGGYFWVVYTREFVEAFKALGFTRRRHYAHLLAAAERAFVAAVDRIRDHRLGPPEVRINLDPDALEWSPTLGDLMKPGEQ